MFKYTRAVLYDIVHDLKTFFRFFSILSQILYISYLTYALMSNLGNQLVNTLLLAISVIYFIVDFILIVKTRKQSINKKIAKRSLRYIKLGVNAFNVGVAIYGVYLTASNANAITVVLTAMMLIFWAIKVIIEIITFFVEHRIELIMAGFHKDIEPLTNVINSVKKITGQKVDTSDPLPTNVNSALEKALEQYKDYKHNK